SLQHFKRLGWCSAKFREELDVGPLFVTHSVAVTMLSNWNRFDLTVTRVSNNSHAKSSGKKNNHIIEVQLETL
ncbi:MAG: hypothetical protein AAGK05_19855, partial [Pseudomonadota bacterium]